ncbi:hypothetical protein Tco_0002827 [Tanacetum coccineum]
MVLRAVLMKSGLVSINTARQNSSKIAVLVNTARQVNTAHSKTTVNDARPMSYLSKIAHSTVKRPIHKNTTFKNSNINQRVNTVRGKNFNTARPKAVVNAVKRNTFNAVKASACWVWKPKHKVLDHVSKHNKPIHTGYTDQGVFTIVIDSGCLRHMIGNMSYLTNYEEIDGGYVAFGGNPKGWKITGKSQRAKKSIELLVVQNIVESINLPLHLFAYGLATKDETSGFLSSFYNWDRNLVDLKVHSLMVLQVQKQVIMQVNIPLWTADPPYFQDPKSSHDDGSKPSSDDGKKVDEDLRKESEYNDQEKEDNVNITNYVNVADINEVDVVGGKTSIEPLFDPNMPVLKDYSIFDFSRDNEDDGAEADMNNLDTTIQVSPIPTTIIHKDHPLEQVIGDLE